MTSLAGIEIRELVTDSRKVMPGDTFVAYPGQSQDGRNHIPQAIAAGAASVIWEAEGFSWNPQWAVANLAVTDLRNEAGFIASTVYGDPSKKMRVIGVTGTNGKTSTTHWIAQALARLGQKTAVIGTIGNGFPGELVESQNTTPDAVFLQREMARYLSAGARAVAMEVSSHALTQGRVNGVDFDIAILTNLTRDHLDYHGDMERYAQAKASLFAAPGLRHAVLNLDDELGRELLTKLEASQVETIGYGFGEVSGDSWLRGGNLRIEHGKMAFEVKSSWGDCVIESAVVGRFNASNLMAVLASLLALEIPLSDAVGALREIQPVPGRMQQAGGDGRPLVVVDYAHTPDALENVLSTLREVVAGPGRLISVFGCGGDRDPGKRPLMGEISTRLADFTILTSDNPRSENPQAILRQIAAGAKDDAMVIEERRAAIQYAVAHAAREDVILIAGKGHENYQETGGVRAPFSDYDEARLALGKWRC